MTIGTEDHALLANDSYQTRKAGDSVSLGGVSYIVLAETQDKLTGYQGTAYVRPDTGEVVVAHCGTDSKRMLVQDVAADAGMVVEGVNMQTADAMAFTKKALELGKQFDAYNHKPFTATVTGHSLGGALAEITAYRYGLHGETFNGYGAAGLFQGIPEGGNQVTNYVRATDVVSAASQHFGITKIYASQDDIDRLNKAGYHDDSGPLRLSNPAAGTNLDAHSATNFLPDNPRLGHSIISPENLVLYQAHKEMIDNYRNDVLDACSVVSLPWEAEKLAAQIGDATAHYVSDKAIRGVHVTERAAQYVGHEAEGAYDDTKEKVVQGAHAVERAGQAAGIAAVAVGEYVGDQAHQAYAATKQAAVYGTQAAERVASESLQGASNAVHTANVAVSQEVVRAYDRLSHPDTWFESRSTESPRLDQPFHPDHAMFKQACDGVQKVDAQHGRTPNHYSENLAGALTVAAKKEGITKIDQVAISQDGSQAFAVQHTSPLKTVASVDTMQAVRTTIDQSTQQLAKVNEAARTNVQAQAQPMQHVGQQEPVLSR